MKKYEIRLSGFGGQGIILAGIVLGEAASLHDGKEATQSQSYGPEARGGTTKADVIVSDEPVDYPKVRQADLLLCMSQESYDKYSPQLCEDGILIVDSFYVKTLRHKGDRVHSLALTEIATQKAGKRIVSNIVALGAIAAVSKIVSLEALRKAVLNHAPAGTESMNMKALEEGYAAARTAENRKPEVMPA